MDNYTSLPDVKKNFNILPYLIRFFMYIQRLEYINWRLDVFPQKLDDSPIAISLLIGSWMETSVGTSVGDITNFKGSGLFQIIRE